MDKRNGLSGWYKLRWEILERDNFTCQYCGQCAPNVALEVDHKVSLSEGGTDDKDNLVAACWACNRGKASLLQSIILKAARARKLRIKDTIQNRILELLNRHGGLTCNEIVKELDTNPDSTKVVLYRMHRTKKLTKLDGKWLIITNCHGLANPNPYQS